jgi:hypothetical protein
MNSECGGILDYLKHLRQILIESRVWIFGEPLWRQALGGEAKGGVARDCDGCAQEQVWDIGHAGDAVPKGKSRARVQHEELKRRQGESENH